MAKISWIISYSYLCMSTYCCALLVTEGKRLRFCQLLVSPEDIGRFDLTFHFYNTFCREYYSRNETSLFYLYKDTYY